VDFTLEMDWLERGAPDIGVPALKVAFPLSVQDGVATFECPNGHVTRPTDGREVPAQKWVDLTGKQEGISAAVGATLLNDSKYGHSVKDNTLCLTLLRSSYDPDPLPEMGGHTIRFAIQPHIGSWTPSDATRAGYAFNFPFNVVGTDTHEGSLPAHKGFGEILTPGVMLSAMKKAEDSEALIVRLYEMEGQAATARIRLDTALAPANAQALETDLLEQPLAQNTAQMEENILSVAIPAFGLVTVKIG